MTSWIPVFVFLLLWLLELPGLVRRRHGGEIAAFTLLWAAGLTVSLIISYGGQVDQVTQLLRSVFEPIGKMVIKPPSV